MLNIYLCLSYNLYFVERTIKKHSFACVSTSSIHELIPSLAFSLVAVYKLDITLLNYGLAFDINVM